MQNQLNLLYLYSLFIQSGINLFMQIYEDSMKKFIRRLLLSIIFYFFQKKSANPFYKNRDNQDNDQLKTNLNANKKI